MGPGEIWATSYRMDRRMWPTIWWSWKTRIYHNDECYTFHWWPIEDSKMRGDQAACDEDGHRNNWRGSRDVLGIIVSYLCCLMYSLQHRNLKERFVCPSTHGHQAINMPFWPLSPTTWPTMGNLVCASLIFQLGVMFYITTEELLIDFRELIGEHSGENMAEAVWATLELYGLIGRACFLSQFTNVFTNATVFTDHRYFNGQCQQQ